jgi:hypothetical protein
VIGNGALFERCFSREVAKLAGLGEGAGRRAVEEAGERGLDRPCCCGVAQLARS